MDLKNAECIWDALNDLHKNDERAYKKFIKNHTDKMHKAKPVKPKFCFCVVADVEKIAIKTKINEYKEKICDYFVYIYCTNKIKAPILPKDFMNNLDNINIENIFISTAKIKGESSRDMYAEAVIHPIIYKNMNNLCFKNKIVTRILEIMNDHEKAFRNDIIVNTRAFNYVELQYVPKSHHYLNPHCVDYNSIEKNDGVDEEDIKFYNILNEKYLKSINTVDEGKKEIKIHNSSSDILSDIKSVKTTKKNNNECTKVNIPRQIHSYHYTIIDRFLHIILTFNNISYEDLEILKKQNNIDIYVSKLSDECMSLNFKENLSDNVKAYFNEKLLKLTISIELLY